MANSNEQGGFSRGGFALIVLLALASVVGSSYSPFDLLLRPFAVVSTTFHEIGHALACVATGGTVKGLTIVPDGQGAAGKTLIQGGNHLVVVNAGYLGASFFGCLLLWLASARKRSKSTLVALSAFIAAVSLTFMVSTVITGGAARGQGALSVLAGLLMSVTLFVAGKKFNEVWAQRFLVFLSVQVVLTALNSVWFLTLVSVGIGGSAPGSDAAQAAKLTGVPAGIWSLAWAVISVAMLYGATKLSFRKSNS